MQIPRIKFNEVNTNRFPIAQGIRNRLGVIGKFSRGPANLFQYVNGFEEFAQVYGSDTASGSIGVQAAYDQGARDFGLIRVLGRDQNASANLIIGGTASQQNVLEIAVVGMEDAVPSNDSNFSIDVNTFGSIYQGGEEGYYAFVVSSFDETQNQATLRWAFYSTDQVQNEAEAVDTLKEEVQKWVANGESAIDGIDFPQHDNTVTEPQDRGTLLVSQTGTAIPVHGGAGLTLTFGGSSSTLDFKEGQSFTVYATYFDFYIPINQGDQSLEVAQKVENTLQAVYPFGSIENALEYVTDQGAPYLSTLTLELDGSDSRLEGTKGNFYYYTAKLQTEPDPNGDLTVTVPNAVTTDGNTTNFKGGVDGPMNASVTLYTAESTRLIELVAASPGEWGNELRLTVNYIDGVSFRINVEDAEADEYNPRIPNESYVINLTQAGAIDGEGEIVALKDSVLLRGYFLPAKYNPTGYNVGLLTQQPRRIAVENPSITDIKDPRHSLYTGPRALGGASFDEETGPIPITFEGGTEGPVLTEDDYVQATKLFEGQQVHYIFAPGTYTNLPKLQAQLVTVAENSTEQDGLKLAILNTKPNLRPSAAFRETLATNSERAIMVTGWSTYAGQPNSPRYGLSPDSVYAGRISNLGFFINPAARTSSGPVVNITEVDNNKYSSLSSLQFYTDARIEVLFAEQSLGGFFFLNGITTSSDPNWEQVHIRRTYDVIRQDLFVGLQNYKSEPHTVLLRKQIETSVNAYMNNQLRNGRIANTTQAIANASNNPPENYISGDLNVSLSFLPLYAAHYINIDIKRNINGGIQIDG